jgi:hypothetical protein
MQHIHTHTLTHTHTNTNTHTHTHGHATPSKPPLPFSANKGVTPSSKWKLTHKWMFRFLLKRKCWDRKQSNEWTKERGSIAPFYDWMCATSRLAFCYTAADGTLLNMHQNVNFFGVVHKNMFFQLFHDFK